MNPTPSTADSAESPIEKVFARVNYERRAIEDGTEFRLDTIRLILRRLGDPHLQLNVVHIAGTKGKGSTAHFVARIGSEWGLKTAIYSSPHFERYTERFVVDNCEVSADVLNPILSKVLAVVEELDQEIQKGLIDLRPATFFDISTATAFLLFAEQGVELVALEVGLGGRLDSTNVCQSMATIVTSISLDHTRQLGSNTTQIAAEKAAIIKSKVPAVSGRVDESVFGVIQKQAQKVGADLTRMDHQFGLVPDSLRTHGVEIFFDYFDSLTGDTIPELKIQTLGEHQVHNACLAVAAILRIAPQLRSGQFNFRSDVDVAIRRGLAHTELQGRLELVGRQPYIVADMAHNEASIDAMIKSLKNLSVSGETQAIFSCSRDKDHFAMLRAMAEFFDRIILTTFENNPRSQSLEVLNRDARMMTESDVDNLSTEWIAIPSPKSAFEHARNLATGEGLIVFCGSIFLVGELLPIAKKTLPLHE